MLQHFLKNVETFSNARAGGKIKRRLFRWAFVGWKFASLSNFWYVDRIPQERGSLGWVFSFFQTFSNFANFTQTNIKPLCNQKMIHKHLLLLKLFKMIFK
jgi:hypothetical protein